LAHYFASDIHLRLDYPERGRRFARFVSALGDRDSLTIVGDLCDFWMGSRAHEAELLACDGLTALVEFRKRGGSLNIMAGNHDLWLCSFYERVLGASIIEEPLDLVVEGLRLRLVHGHRLGARAPWKAILESRAFFFGFGLVPMPFARRLDALLAEKNARELLADEERHLVVYRAYARELEGEADLVILGHVHRPVDESGGHPRLIVLGGWQKGTSFLKIDRSGPTFSVRLEGSPATATAAASPNSH
jgi:UDP-2,3-diacylglucosamine hydrolase